MNEHDIFKAIGNVGVDLIAESAEKKKKKHIVPILIAAALALILIFGSVAAHFVYSERADYDRAVVFFAENELSTEGLTRDEIKSVYRDISSGAFAEPKTAEVLSKLSLEKYLTELLSLDAETLRELWQTHVEYLKHLIPAERRYTIEQDDSEKFLDCHEGEELIWRAPLASNISVELVVLDDRLLVYGYRNSISSFSYPYASSLIDPIPKTPLAFMFDKDGTELWRYDPGGNGSLDAVIISDGELIFFGNMYDLTGASVTPKVWYKVDPVKMKFTRISLDGAVLEEKTLDVADTAPRVDSVEAAVKTPAGYLVQVSDSQLVLLTHELEYVKTVIYFNDTQERYNIHSILYHEGNVWVSAYTGINEDASKKINEISSEYSIKWLELNEEPPFEGEEKEELTSALISSCSSVLLMCDAEGNEIREIACEQGAVMKSTLIPELKLDRNGNVSWQILKITGAKPEPPQYSSRFVILDVDAFDLTFNSDGTLISRKEAGSATITHSY